VVWSFSIFFPSPFSLYFIGHMEGEGELRGDVLVLACGGTIGQREVDGRMAVVVPAADLLGPVLAHARSLWPPSPADSTEQAGDDVKSCGGAPPRVDVMSVVARSGVYMGWDGLLALRDAVVTHRRHYRAFLVICGTDSMVTHTTTHPAALTKSDNTLAHAPQEEVAFALELLIDPAADSLGRPVVVTGAMKPHDVLGYDGYARPGRVS
jgi:L-asparaginase/Glu-tRNA(Gln) amidotransferase subunit D